MNNLVLPNSVGRFERASLIGRFWLSQRVPLSINLFPATDSFGSLLESSGKGVAPRSQQQLAAFWSARENQIHGPNQFPPSLGKEFGVFLFSCKSFWNSKIVFMKNTPDSMARQ